MASIEFITKRLEGKKAELEKLTAKQARIEKAAASNWVNNPYYYNESDLKKVARDIKKAEEAIAEYQQKLNAEQEKANSRNVEVIIEFLENWKEQVRTFYADEFAKYPAAREERTKELEELREKYADARRRPGSQEWKEYRNAEKAIDKAFTSQWGFLAEYVDGRIVNESVEFTFNHEKFEKMLKLEAERKYDEIIERTNYIVGEITDASGLRIGYKGDLNGIVTGTRGRAKVNTIGAGGYNIQCFHFRTLIREA